YVLGDWHSSFLLYCAVTGYTRSLWLEYRFCRAFGQCQFTGLFNWCLYRHASASRPQYEQVYSNFSFCRYVQSDVLCIFWFLRSEEHTSELQSRENLVCRLLLEKKK